jgi:hypothetical protein
VNKVCTFTDVIVKADKIRNIMHIT